MEECIPPSRVRKGKELMIWLFYEKSAQVVVRFRAQKVLSRQIHEKSFSISSWTYSTELRAGEEVYPTQKGQIDKRFLIWLFYETSAQVVVRFRAQKILSRQFQEKCFPISSWNFSTELRAGRRVYPS